MKLRSVVASVLSLTFLLTIIGNPHAAPNARGGHGGGKRAETVTVTPDSLTLAVSSASVLNVCVSGFAEGNFVSIVVPWVGTPESHSDLSFSRYVDQTGGFCVQCPPTWTSLNLQPGAYTIRTIWYRDGGSDQRNSGPSTSFTVTSSE